MRVTIKVEQEDLDKGQPGTGFNCPIALAIVKKLIELEGYLRYVVDVKFSYVDIYPVQADIIRIYLPDIAQEFIIVY